jgi:hypothetical protein
VGEEDEPREAALARLRLHVSSSGDVLDHLDEFVDGVSLSASELDQLPDLLDDGAAFGCSGDGDSASASSSSSPSSWSSRSERRTVLVLTPSTVARSRAGGSRSPGLASPSAIARRIWAATWR